MGAKEGRQIEALSAELNRLEVLIDQSYNEFLAIDHSEVQRLRESVRSIARTTKKQDNQKFTLRCRVSSVIQTHWRGSIGYGRACEEFNVINLDGSYRVTLREPHGHLGIGTGETEDEATVNAVSNACRAQIGKTVSEQFELF